ncbi:Trk system potassium transporter TrkA [uncultured Bacteroides sp.]|uniref:Trk system potassium transporter TrkA n=1 Tax=Bacteroides sp. L10-4 TaxID=2746063 RepID=UPI001595005C|nr:Trk system potassium transporter TrkA [uncultured Bacteroides sp.]NVK93844.1 Trk system potassium transporter TrkA [Bacteroides sp. L10-4]
MKIIIAGAGAVGTHLAKLLSREKQDIILMDDNEERLTSLSSNFDLMTVVASPTSIKGLKEVGAGEADLFIAVTPDESRNMTACMLATNLGAEKTVARIDNYEYLLPKHKEFFKKLGVDSLIYPEMLAAKEIVSAVRMSWVRQWWEFCGGALVLIGTKMREKAEILNIPLHELGGPEMPYHIVAIKRGSETKIPRGDDTIRLHDIVYFTTTRKYIPYIRKIAGKEEYADIRNVMIMGGSRIAVRTAQYVPDYMQLKIIENDLSRCNRLTELLDDSTMIINGDGRDMDLLVEEGLKNTEAFVALTDNSETNILACLAAKRMGVAKTVAEVENIDYIGMAESLDIGTVINKKMIAASHIYQMMLDADVSNVKCLTFANADVAEFTVKAGSKITKHPVKDLGLPKGATIGGLIRQGEGVVVMGNTLIQPGDHVVVFCLNMMIKKIEKYFN